MISEINNIKLKEATTNIERQILGLLDGETKRIGYGKIILEFTIQAGNLKTIQIIENRRSVKLD